MKKVALSLLSILLALSAFAQKEINNKPAMVYSLPKTVLVVKATACKTTQQAGPYFRYAERYLGISDVVTENKTSYELTKVTVLRKGIADPLNTFQSTKNALITLTSKGVISGINTTCSIINKESNIKNKKEESDADFIANTVLTEDQLVANSIAKMAENAAKQIYRIRESRINLISGESEQMPDGAALKLMLKKLDQTEKALVALFTGKVTKEYLKKEFEIEPDKNRDNEILFRVSTINGLVDKDDLSGIPVYVSIKTTKNNTPQVKAKNKTGLYYRLPGTAEVIVNSGEKEFFREKLTVSQHGSLQKLPRCSSKNTKITYDIKTGAIKNMQE